MLALPDFKLNGVSTGVSTDITIYVSEGAESSLSAFKAADNGVVWSGSSSSIVLTNVGNDAVAAGTPHSITISKFANLYLPSTGLVANAAPITLASSSSQGSSPPAQAGN